MYQRRLFPELEEHLAAKQITVITGMRRVGKSTALKYLLEKLKHSNKVYLDLERIENRYIFQQPTYKDVQIDLEIQGIDFDKPAVIAIDEIQLVPQITSVMKWFYDTYPNLKFIVTGSSSFYLKNRFSESLAGRKHIFEMYPLDFLEFLWFKGEDTKMLEAFCMKPFQQGIYLKFKDKYEEFLRFGGYPEVVLMDGEKLKKRTILDVINAYIELDIRLVSDFEASGTLYKLAKLLASRSGSLLDTSKISSALGIDRRKTVGYIELLEKTYFIHQVSPFTKSPDREISLRQKIYLADTGLLNQLAQVNSGQVFENAVFLQLLKLGRQINFYQRKSGQEIDFVLDQKIACEVKETPHPSYQSTLNSRANYVGITETMLIGKNRPDDNWQAFTWAGQLC
jgi:predicted AAA+ superfamily ATPase